VTGEHHRAVVLHDQQQRLGRLLIMNGQVGDVVAGVPERDKSASGILIGSSKDRLQPRLVTPLAS
jgi:hypothetical protein